MVGGTIKRADWQCPKASVLKNDPMVSAMQMNGTVVKSDHILMKYM